MPCMADTTDLIVFPDSEGWLATFGTRQFRCAIGRGGVVPAEGKREGDGATPLGRLPMRRLFYRPDRGAPPPCRIDCRGLRPDDGWCDDPAHPDYNRLVKLPFEASHEKLWREDELYDLIVVLGHNDSPPEAYLGSAIFLHCAKPDYSPTLGCVALRRPDLEVVLAGITPESVVEVREA